MRAASLETESTAVPHAPPLTPQEPTAPGTGHFPHPPTMQLHRLATHLPAPRRHARSLAVRVRGSSESSSAAVVFPHGDSFTLPDGRELTADQVVSLLQPSVSPERLAKMQQVVASRCYGVVPVVEGLYDVGNLAAVCRSADALGFGAVHCVMQPSDKYKRSQRTAAGADKWLDTQLWSSTADCLHGLKAAGYQIIVTALDERSVPIQDVDWARPTAFVLGNEQRGVSTTALALADATAIIPMAGFVESFNISVAAALTLYEARQQRRARLGRTGDLSEEQQRQLLASFLLRGVRHGRQLVAELLDREPPAFQRKFFKASAQRQARDAQGRRACGVI